MELLRTQRRRGGWNKTRKQCSRIFLVHPPPSPPFRVLFASLSIYFSAIFLNHQVPWSGLTMVPH